ncbi:MAG: hotdog fold thioesterase [Halioglobus sp.]|nr:hotdog fold thioesterase [Halioglobus sp.]
MTAWKKAIDLTAINAMSSRVAPGLAGIEFIEIGPDFLIARMPVEARTHQPFGLLHGGMSCVLAETMGSTGSYLAIDDQSLPVGTDINASHVRGVKSGWVTGIARPIKLGRRMHFWAIDISDDESRRVCAARLTVAIVKANETRAS